MSDATLLVKIESHVRNLFALHPQPFLFYHNLSHTEKVVKHTAALSGYYHLAAQHHFILMTTAWFHDTGHLFGDMENHEERSVTLMTKYLEDSISPLYLKEIQQCIMATKMPVHPMNILEKIICDADTWHLGTEDFPQEDKNVWRELEARRGKTFENKAALSLKFMQQHQFYTSYCIQQLSEGKLENEAALRAIL